MKFFAAHGFVALDVDYRYVSPYTVDPADIYQSLAFLKSRPFVNAAAVFVNGFSLGARWAMHVAAHAYVAAASGIGTSATFPEHPTVLQDAALIRCPVLLQHGTMDDVVPYRQSILLQRKLQRLGRTVELVSYPGCHHSDLPWEEVYRKVLDFFRAHLRH